MTSLSLTHTHINLCANNMASVTALPKKPPLFQLGSPLKRIKTSSPSLRCYAIQQLIYPPAFGNGVKPSVIPKHAVTRQDFPVDFKFGCGSSAFQIEGRGDEGGRGPGVWDTYILADQGYKAADSYYRYREDVQMLKQMGADTYRFSIAWPRIVPDGTLDSLNQQGIDFYNNLIDECLNNGITPFVTLTHFDLPQALQDMYGGFLSSQIVDDFKAYADICFHNFGDRVKYWTTINEPQIFSKYGPNPVANAEDTFLAAHNMILAHATAVKHYRENYQNDQRGEIGMSMVVQWFEPYSNTPQDKAAALRAFDFWVGWLMEPLVYGDYPFIMKALAKDKLPEFSDDEKALVKGSFDFIGVNYYTSRYAASIPISSNYVPTSADEYLYVDSKVDRNGVPIGELAPGSDSCYVYPKGLTEALVFMKETYQNPKIYITENGYPEKREDTIPVEIATQDNARIQHILNHLNAISEAMKMGANVKGYLMWSLLDDVEFESAYNSRFGLTYIDYLNDLKRIPKKSAKWLNSFLKSSPTPF